MQLYLVTEANNLNLTTQPFLSLTEVMETNQLLTSLSDEHADHCWDYTS